MLEVSVNPQKLGLESDYENNKASCTIRFDEVYSIYYGWEESVEIIGCTLSGESLLE